MGKLCELSALTRMSDRHPADVALAINIKWRVFVEVRSVGTL
jgi:hypothetical protein